MSKAATRGEKPTHQRPDIIEVERENPLWTEKHHGNSRYITVAINAKESAITTLFARDLIDEGQKEAADRFRRAWEAMGGVGARAIDYSREQVDGGGPREPITLRQLKAGEDLKAAEKALRKEHGYYAYRLVLSVVGDGRSIHELTETRRQRDTMTDNLRQYLDVLAILWGYSNRGTLRKRNELTSRIKCPSART